MAAVAIGGLVTVFPFLAGALVVSDPLRKGRREGDRKFIRVAALDAVPGDGAPHAFPVIDERQDAWTHYPPEPVGSVFLIRRPGESGVRCFNAVCPHAGCLIGYLAQKKYFQCPCHTSAFDLDGAILIDVSAVSPRGMDSLDCEVRTVAGVEEVWVKFENFQTGLKEKIPTV
jgi:menaquinol-cytochrome c reductase iron-sulfur subunit